MSSEAPSLFVHHIDLPGAHAVDDNGFHSERSLRVTRGASIQGHPSSLEDPGLFNQRQDISVGISPSVHADRSSERPGYLGKDDGFTDPKGESNVLFVDGLPTDCTRREVGRILFLCLYFSVCGCFSFATYFRLIALLECTGLETKTLLCTNCISL